MVTLDVPPRIGGNFNRADKMGTLLPTPEGFYRFGI